MVYATQETTNELNKRFFDVGSQCRGAYITRSITEKTANGETVEVEHYHYEEPRLRYFRLEVKDGKANSNCSTTSQLFK